jgi:hypothetical protein
MSPDQELRTISLIFVDYNGLWHSSKAGGRPQKKAVPHRTERHF